jgi:glucose-6-phosphate 1-dehydrogenase
VSTLTLDPAIITIFGVTGDLAKRKLLPALYDLVQGNVLPDQTKIVGLSRKDTTPGDIIKTIRQSIEGKGQAPDQAVLDTLEASMSIVHMNIDNPDEYIKLKSHLDEIEEHTGTCLARMFYMAIPSGLFEMVVNNLGTHSLNKGCQHENGDSRLLIEKPFGSDTESAKKLIETLQKSFTEQQTYRIDHYLAKETVQNILTFRFQNSLFANAWDNHHISKIEITASESIDIEGRANFYESVGAFRDIIQSHLLQLLSLIAMDKPDDMSSDSIHARKVELLSQVRSPTPESMSEETVRGQYENYRTEVENQESNVETFASIKLSIDSDKWKGVPVFIHTGKALSEKATEIKVVYEQNDDSSDANVLLIRIQPNEGFTLDLDIKKPGYAADTERIRMNYYYYHDTQNVLDIDAYERVIVDALRADKTLFATSEEVLASWKISQPILNAWHEDRVPLTFYPRGTKVAEIQVSEGR